MALQLRRARCGSSKMTNLSVHIFQLRLGNVGGAVCVSIESKMQTTQEAEFCSTRGQKSRVKLGAVKARGRMDPEQQARAQLLWRFDLT